MKTTYRIFIPLLLVFLFTGCNSFLEEHPKSDISPDMFYKSTAQIEGVLANSFSGYGNWFPWYIFKHSDELSGGDLVIGSDHGSDLWEKQFNVIMNMNHVIYAIQNNTVEDGTQDEIDNLLGMARFIRGWAYFCLVRFWGPVPILTEKDVEGNYFMLQPSRSPIRDVYDLIISDFQAGIDLMWDNPGQASKPSRQVAKAFLAKAYLTMATYPLNDASYYAKAAEMAWEVIQDGQYSLVEDIDKVFSFETEDGPEIMLSFQANETAGGDYPEYFSAIRGWWEFVVSSHWADQYPEQPRKNAYLELYDDEGNYYKDLSVNAGIRKYFYGADWDRSWSVSQIPIMRFADVLLIYAEAANMANGGPTEEAVWALNSIISRANAYEENPDHPLATMDLSKEAFDERVIDERNWELCFEPAWGRWSDLIRKRILKDKVNERYVQNFSEDDYLFPIPENDLNLNRNLEQNPGYVNPYKD